MRRSVLAGLFIALCAAASFSQEAAWRPGRSSVQIPVRDGKELAADVHLPPEAGRYPVIVIQTPYGRHHHGAERPGGSMRGLYDTRNYVYVVVDWRGFHGSRSARTPGRRPLGRDGHDVVEWAAAQPWSTGRVGTWGPSALGVVQYETAAERPPHLVCAVPLVASYGHRHDDYYTGGVLREQHVADLDRLGFGVGGAVLRARSPDAAAYRVARGLEKIDRIDVPMLVVTGWFDHGTTRQLETFGELLAAAGPRARAGSRLLVGPWHHTALDAARQGDLGFAGAAGEIERETRRFFDHHLRGEDNDWQTRARVRVWRANEEGWIESAAWPAADAPRRTFHLRSDGSLSVDAPAADEPARRYVDDPARPVPTLGGANLPIGLDVGPRDQARLVDREDVLVYTGALLDEPLRIEGRPEVTVRLRADAVDVDVAVRLCDVLPDGRTMLVADSIQRASRRAGAAPAWLTPGEPVDVTVALPSLGYTLPKGHRLRILVSGTNWPRFERNGHTAAPGFDAATATPAAVEILSGPAHPSRVVIPLAPR